MERRIKDKGELPVKYTGKWWAVNFIKQITFLSLTHWQLRNEEEHREKERNEKERKRVRLIEEVRNWYEKKDDFDTKHKIMFKEPITQRCLQPIMSIEAWVRTIKTIYSNYTSAKSGIANCLSVK